ncbi:MAG: hypothetical protein V3W31_08905 [Thermodesulfobacteriota bacterium]
MRLLDFIRHRRLVKSCKRKILEETSVIIKELECLAREKPKNAIKALQKHQLMMAGIRERISDYFAWIHNDKKNPSYTVSSLFLLESFKLLNRREVESLHFVTGPEIEGTKVLDKIVDFRLEKQSVVYAKADAEAIREALIYLSEHGFKLWGCFHIHPGAGPSSIFPSGTDKTLDRLLNKGGYDCVGAIFSRDGYVRFFSSKKFEVNIYGNGVEKVDEKLYRLIEVH